MWQVIMKERRRREAAAQLAEAVRARVAAAQK
jgi:hypothetical protein